MTSINIRGNQILGLQLGIDSRRVDPAHAMVAKNILFSADGPKSAFGSRCACEDVLLNPKAAQTLRIGNDSWLFSDQGIWRYDAPREALQSLAAVPDTSVYPYRWTYALVNGVYFFCHPIAGILYWDTADPGIGVYRSAYLLGEPIAICESSGRLFILTTTHVQWSAQDDGFDVEPSLTTLANVQSLSLVGGEGIMVSAYPGGVIVFTTTSIMRSELTGDIAVFRHRRIRVGEARVKLLNSFCVVRDDQDNVIFMDETGLHTTRGDIPQPWQPIFSEYLREVVFPSAGVRGNWNIRMEYDSDFNRLYISLGFANSQNLYEFAWVLHTPSGQWSQMNRKHYGVGPWSPTGGALRGIYWAGILDDRRLHLFPESLEYRAALDTDEEIAIRYRPKLARSFYEDRASRSFVSGTALRMACREEGARFADPQGLQSPDGYWRLAEIKSGLDSVLKIGVFRYVEQQYADELGFVTDLRVDSVPEASPDDVLVDYNAITGTQDWNATDGEQDWGDGAYEFRDYQCYLESTLDTHTAIGTAENIGTAVNQSIATASRYFALDGLGQWHALRFEATEPDDFFQIKALEISGQLGGRL